MTVFVCPTCGGTDEQPLASRMWHWCRGRERELRRVDPEPQASAPKLYVRGFGCKGWLRSRQGTDARSPVLRRGEAPRPEPGGLVLCVAPLRVPGVCPGSYPPSLQHRDDAERPPDRSRGAS